MTQANEPFPSHDDDAGEIGSEGVPGLMEEHDPNAPGPGDQTDDEDEGGPEPQAGQDSPLDA